MAYSRLSVCNSVEPMSLQVKKDEHQINENAEKNKY